MKTKVPRSFGRSWLFAMTGCLASAMCVPFANAQTVIPINNSGFDGGGGGEISGVLTLLGGTSAAGPQEVGTSGWYGTANSTNLTVPLLGDTAGFRPGIEVDNDASSAGVGELRYNLGASLGGLLGLETPEATLWQPITGVSLQANSTYEFSVDVDAGALLDLSAFSDRGFGLGITTGSSESSIGTYAANSLSEPALLDIDLLGGSNQRLTFTFTTGDSVPSGDIGVAIFAGRGSQTLQVDLLSDFDVDNASLTVVPEPSSVLLAGLGLFVVLNSRAFFRRRSGNAA